MLRVEDIRLRRGTVLVKVLPAEERTKGGIILPDAPREKQEKNKARRGIVLALGPEAEHRKKAFSRDHGRGEFGDLLGYKDHVVKVGDEVIFQRIWWHEVDARSLRFSDDEREQFFVLKQHEDLIAVIEHEAA